MINKNVHQYKLEQSPLYKLRNRGKLAKMLDLPPNYFRSSYKCDIKYDEFFIKTGRNKKQRLIQSPSIKLKITQKKLLKYISRIETPNWLISGKKGKSYIDNAKFHKNNKYMITTDIQDFYPSCKRHDVYVMFIKIFKMEKDIAGIITDIVTYNDGIPTGAPTSQMIAYWSHRDMFMNINKISEIYNVCFSLYVDDMAFSSTQFISKKLLYEIQKELKKCNLRLKKNKTNIYNSTDFKLTTGVIYNIKGELKVPNKLRKEIIDKFNEINKLENNESECKKASLLGKIYSARQIEPYIFSEMLRNLKK